VTDERRSERRVSLNLPVRWDGLAGASEARVEDIGLGGCFVNSRGHVDVGELVSLEIKLPSGEQLDLRGEVTSYQPGIGFGVVFPFLTEDEEEALRELIS